MINLPSAFWSGWVIVLTLGSSAVLVWLVCNVFFSAQANDETADTHVWDETLREGDSPPPMWWFWLIYVALIFSAIYLLLYPGLGSYRGALQWSQAGHLHDSSAAHELEFEQRKRELSLLEPAELARDPVVMRSAATLFANHCGSCHGVDGAGQGQFPNLRDSIWQWGGDPSAIASTIKLGRNAVMPAWGAVFDEKTLSALTEFVQKLGRSDSVVSNDSDPGATAFAQTCASCHGPNGSGNAALGAPNLTDNDWLYGSSSAAIHTSISEGRNGVMPAHGERLSEFQQAALTAWLYAGGLGSESSEPTRVQE